jgi:hypothetical protein
MHCGALPRFGRSTHHEHPGGRRSGAGGRASGAWICRRGRLRCSSRSPSSASMRGSPPGPGRSTLPALRTLDAIHLATAIALGVELTAFISYDEKLSVAARGIGLTVIAPA